MSAGGSRGRDARLAALLALAVLALWGLVRGGALEAVDLAVLGAARVIPPGVATIVTTPGDTIVRFAIAGIAALALVVAGRRRDAGFLVLAVAGGVLVVEAVKLAADRARPLFDPTIETVAGTSFPSAHAAGAAILFGAVALLAPATGRGWAIGVAVVAALLVGVSRLALGVHWPSDVVAGWLLGAAWVFLCRALLDRTPAKAGVMRD